MLAMFGKEIDLGYQL